MMPTPRSKPSRTTYALSISTTIQNQRVLMGVGSLRGEGLRVRGLVGCARAVLDVVIDEDDPEQREQRIHAEEAEQGEEAIACADVGRCAGGGANETEDEPGLAADFSGQPA